MSFLFKKENAFQKKTICSKAVLLKDGHEKSGYIIAGKSTCLLSS